MRKLLAFAVLAIGASSACANAESSFEEQVRQTRQAPKYATSNSIGAKTFRRHNGYLQKLLADPASITITGWPSVWDGDTLVIDGKFIHLFGIDAPEQGQACVGPKPGTELNEGIIEPYDCGEQASEFLKTRVRFASAKRLSCTGNKINGDKQLLAVCWTVLEKGTRHLDVGGEMVSAGEALANREQTVLYVPDENTARRYRIGVWSGTFLAPWQWRKAGAELKKTWAYSYQHGFFEAD